MQNSHLKQVNFLFLCAAQTTQFRWAYSFLPLFSIRIKLCFLMSSERRPGGSILYRGVRGDEFDVLFCGSSMSINSRSSVCLSVIRQHDNSKKIFLYGKLVLLCMLYTKEELKSAQFLTSTLQTAWTTFLFFTILSSTKGTFAVTINKAQGQSLEMYGLDLDVDCFSHGQLYVVCSRVGKPDSLYIYTNNGKTKNIVYPQVLKN